MFIALLLAAGKGSRFRQAGGTMFKLLEKVAPDCTVVRRACENLLTLGWPVHVVVGSDAEDVKQALDGLNVHFIPNPYASDGIASSIVCGVTQTAGAQGWLIAFGDMPFIQPATIRQIGNRLRTDAGIVFPMHREVRGHPVGFGSRFYPDLQRLTGDRGAQQILATYPDDCIALEVEDEGVLRDVDVPEDLHGAGTSPPPSRGE